MAAPLQGRVALVTGAARGQGRSHAVRLAQDGADIVALDICAQLPGIPYRMAVPDDLDETVRQVEALDRRIVAATADVRDLAALRAEVDNAVATLGRLDIVCANAGVICLSAVLDLTPQMWDEVVGTCLTGVFNTIKATVPHLVAGGRGGAIVATGSAVALRPVPGASHYIAAKAGVIGLVKALALELAEHRIRVNSVHPTNCDTDMIQNPALRKAFLPDVAGPTREQSEPVYTALNALPVPWVQPIDVSNAIAFLVSDNARYVTGVQFPVDAGFQLN